MLDAPQIIQTTPELRAFIHLTIPRDEIREVMGPGLEELRAAVSAQNIEVTGPWFTHHRQMEPGIFDFEISVPVASAVTPVGRVQPGEWPAIRAARTVYHGDYSGLGEAWGELDDWVEANGHTPAPDLWERYLIGWDASPDPDAWRTELTRPLIAS